MLDVHAPHKRLEGVKEILLHLFVITLGLLIATQIEACEEWRAHVHLAAEARASLRVEIEQNLNDLKSAAPGLEEWRKQVSSNLETLEKIQKNPNDPAAQNGQLTIGAHDMTLRSTAWKTAESTGALAYMPYAEAQKYAGIYAAQERLLAAEHLPSEDSAHAAGLVAKFGLAQKSRLTAEQAAALEDVFGQSAFHLAESTGLLQENIELNQAFLEGREPRGYFNQPLW